MLSNDKKRQVKVRLNEYFDFEQPVPSVIESLQDMLERHPTAFLEYDYLDPYSDQRTLILCAYREETDEEQRKRFYEAKQQEYWERRQYEALKAKFEKTPDKES